MTNRATGNTSRWLHTAILIAIAFGASCSSDDDPLSEDATEEMVELPAAGAKADGFGHSEVTPGIRWLSERDESELHGFSVAV